MTIQNFQKQIEAIYYTRDAERGVPLTFTWFVEEVGELAKEIRKQPQDIERLREEFADVFAWLATLASLLGIDLQILQTDAVQRNPLFLFKPHSGSGQIPSNSRSMEVLFASSWGWYSKVLQTVFDRVPKSSEQILNVFLKCW